MRHDEKPIRAATLGNPATGTRDSGWFSATNAWNQNFGDGNAGNQNNNNKNNTNKRVRPVRKSTVAVTGPEVTINEVLTAYLDCRKRKRSRDTTTLFELNLTRNIADIKHALHNQTWQPGSSMCFVVTSPKPREVWAATFADRVVHHVIYNRLRPRIEPGFISTSFACIKQRGALAGAQWAHQALRRSTNGWSQTAWALQLDIANFFPTIDRHILWQLLERHCHEEWLRTATYRVVFHNVIDNAYFPGDPAKLLLIPKAKSLWHAPADKGLPIGNLTSQFAANVYLNEVDWFIKDTIRPEHYGRYVDDLLLVDRDKDKLIDARNRIQHYLENQLLLALHHGKTHLQRVEHGVDFVGWRLMPHRRYLRRGTVNRARQAFKDHADDAEALLASLNSYLGIARHGNTWNLRGHWLKEATSNSQLLAAPDRTKAIGRKNAVLRTR